MNEKFLEQLKGIYIKLGGQEDLTAENSLIVILDKIYKQMGGEKEFKEFSVPEAIDLIEDEVGGGGGGNLFQLSAQVIQTVNSKTVNLVGQYNGATEKYEAEVILDDANASVIEYDTREYPFHSLYYKYIDIFSRPARAAYNIDLVDGIMGRIYIDENNKIVLKAQSSTEFDITYTTSELKFYVANENISEIFDELNHYPPS